MARIPYISAERNDVLKSLDNRVEYYKVIVLWLLSPANSK